MAGKGYRTADKESVSKLWKQLSIERKRAITTYPPPLFEQVGKLVYGHNVKGDQLHLNQPWRLILDKQGSLGPLARLIIIRCLISKTSHEFLISYKNTKDKSDSHSFLHKIWRLHLTPEEVKLPDADTLQRITGQMLDAWRCSKQLIGGNKKEVVLGPHPELNMIYKKPFTGNGAIRNFEKFLLKESSPLIVRSSRLTQPASKQSDFVARISKDVRKGSSMLINVHKSEHWESLRNFSEELAESLHKSNDEREVLHISLRATVPRVGDPVDYEPMHKPLPWLIRRLYNFAHRGININIDDSYVFEETPDFINIVNKIRIALLEKPKILILDGLYVGPDTRNESTRVIEKIIEDDHVEFVLSRLLQPITSGYSPAQNLKLFSRNRFIVTSDYPLNLADVSPSVSGVSRPILEPLPRQTEHQFREIIKETITKTNADAVSTLAFLPKFKAERSDAVLQCLDAFVNIVKNLQPELIDNPKHHWEDILGYGVQHHSSGRALESVLTSLIFYLQYLSNLKSNNSTKAGVWLEILLITAFTPEGIKAVTFERLIARMSWVPEASQDLPFMREAGGENIRQNIDELVMVAKPILGFLRLEFLEGPEIEDHTFEYWESAQIRNMPRSIKPHPGVGEAVKIEPTLDYRYPEVRNALRAIRITGAENTRYVVNALLCEIAVQSETVSLRHSEQADRSSIRNWRRLVAAIYYGLASIKFEVAKDSAQNSPYFKPIETDYGVRDIDIAGGEKEYWLFLYAKLFRRVLERPNTWRITRIYGLEDLKTAFLDLFDEPWILDPTFPASSHVNNAGGLFQQYSDIPKLNDDYKLSRIRIALMRGEVSLARKYLPSSRELIEKCINEKDSSRKEFLDFKYCFKYLKAKLDRNIYALEYVDMDRAMNTLSEVAEVDTGSLMSMTENLSVRFDDGKVHTTDVITLLDNNGVDSFTETLLNRHSTRTSAEFCELYTKIGEYISSIADISELGDLHVLDGTAHEVSSELIDKINTLAQPKQRIRTLRCQALAYFVIAERIRLNIFRNDPVGTGFTRSSAQTRVGIRLAQKLHEIEAKDGNLDDYGYSPYFRFARRLSDSSTRTVWLFPREQANALIIEASLLRTMSSGSIDLLSNARKMIGKAEMLLTGPNLASRVIWRLVAERSMLNRELLNYFTNEETHKDNYAKENIVIFKSHLDHDLNILSQIAFNGSRPYWQVLSSAQHIGILEE